MADRDAGHDRGRVRDEDARTDAELLDAIAGGSRDALAVLYRRHAPWLVLRLQRRCAGVHPGSPGWHDAYLAALCGMAAAGALLRTTPRRWRVLGAGAACTAAAALTGWAQLP